MRAPMRKRARTRNFAYSEISSTTFPVPSVVRLRHYVHVRRKNRETTMKRARIYIIYADPQDRRTKGRFLFGGRSGAPWSGFGQEEQETDED